MTFNIPTRVNLCQSYCSKQGYSTVDTVRRFLSKTAQGPPQSSPRLVALTGSWNIVRHRAFDEAALHILGAPDAWYIRYCREEVIKVRNETWSG